MRRKTASTVTATLGLVALIAFATPADALGQRTEPCGVHPGGSYVGESTTKAATTSQGAVNACGDVGVRARYKTYEGSPVYLSSWKYGALSAKSTPGNIMVGGDHKVTDGGWAFINSFTT